MVLYDFKMVQPSQAVVWKCVLQDFGGRFAMTSGMTEMLLLSVGSLDTMILVSSHCFRCSVIRVLPRIENWEEGVTPVGLESREMMNSIRGTL